MNSLQLEQLKPEDRAPRQSPICHAHVGAAAAGYSPCCMLPRGECARGRQQLLPPRSATDQAGLIIDFALKSPSSSKTDAARRLPARTNFKACCTTFRAVQSFTAVSSGHGTRCGSGSCLQSTRAFSVKSQTSYNIPKTQTAVIYEADNTPLQVREDWPVVQPENLKPGEVLVRIAYTSVCHSDLSVWEGEGPPLPQQFPMVSGHEGAGYIAAIGEHTRTNLKVGDAVGVKWLAHTCLGCEDCRKGHETTCASAGVHGLTCHGSFQQWCVSFADHVTPIPAGLDLSAAAPILCAGMTVYKALKQIGGSPGEYVVIPGAGGGLGHLACQYARAMGYKVVAIDTGDDKRKLIESYGIKDFIDFKEGNVVEQVRVATGGRGGRATVVVAGSKDECQDPLMFLRLRGTLVAVGAPKDTAIVAPVDPLTPLEFRIVGSYGGSRQDAIDAIDLAADGQVKSSYTVEPLKSPPDVLKRMHDGKQQRRVVFDCEYVCRQKAKCLGFQTIKTYLLSYVARNKAQHQHMLIKRRVSSSFATSSSKHAW